LDYFVAVTQQDSFLCSLPLLDVCDIIKVYRSFGLSLFCELESHWAELAITLEIGLEVLQENNFLINRSWVVEEGVFSDLLYCVGSLLLITDSLNVNEVEQIG
jgi:hypothetical protein